MKNIYIYFIIVFCIQNSYAQQLNLDSLKNRLLVESKRKKIETYIDISELPISRDTAILYLRKATTLAKEIGFDSIYPIQFSIAASYYIKGDLINAKKEIIKGKENYLFTKFPNATMGHIDMLMGAFNEGQNNVDSASYYYNKVLLQLSGENYDKAREVLSSTLNNYANLYYKQSEYHRAIDIYFRGVELAKETGDKKAELILYNNLANCYADLENYKQAKFYYEKAKAIAVKNNNLEYQSSVEVGLGEILLTEGQVTEALIYFNKAISVLNTIDFKRTSTLAYKGRSGALLILGKVREAEVALFKAEKLSEYLNDNYLTSTILLLKGQIEINKKESSNAEILLDQALLIATDNNYKDLQKDIILNKIINHKKANKYAQLPELYDQLITIKEEVLNNKTTKSIADVQEKYQTEQKQKEILKLRQKETEQQLKISEGKNKNLIFAGAASILLFGFIWFYYTSKTNQRQRKRDNELKSRQIAQENRFNIILEREKQKDEIALKLHGQSANELEHIAAGLKRIEQNEWAERVLNIKNNLKELARDVQQIPFSESSFVDQTYNLMTDERLNELEASIEGIEDVNWQKVPEAIKRNLLLIVREGISNIHNHSDATELSLHFSKINNELSLIMKDNGKGFNISETTKGIGLRNMKAKAEGMSGKMIIESLPEKGSKLIFNIILN